MESEPPVVEPLEWTGTTGRKRDAKRFNEHVKLAATFLNNFAIALLVTGVLAPAINGVATFTWSRALLVFVGSLRATRLCAGDPPPLEE